MSTSSGNGDSTLSPTKGSSTDKPLDDDHSPSAVGKMEVFSESEIEVVSQRRVSKRPRASDSISSTYESVSTSLRQTKNRASERETAESDTGASTAYLQDLAYRLTGLTKGQKRPLPSHLPTPNELQGHRDFPDGFPTPDLLYATDDRPGALPKVLPVYKCVCCGNVKSCPVWFPNCKHSACYVCTFLHLEASWACPECARPMHEAPRRDYGLEEEIHRQYPEWTDGSVVTYAFSRFTFPRRPVALKYDHSERGRQVRRERVRSRRKIAKVHIPRLVLPDLVEEWACADLRQTRKVFIAAHRLADEFEEIEFTHWISPPPFDAAAISLADEPPEGNYNDWLASLVDGCLLRREEAFEAGLKEQLELIGQKKMWDRLRTEVKRLLTQDWAVLRGQEALYEQGTRERAIYERHLIFLARRMYRMYYLRFPAPPVVFALDITTIKFFFFPTPISLHPSMSTTPRYPTFFTRFFTSPPTRDDPLKRQELKRDSELPRGEIRSFVNAVTDKHWQITLIGRIVAVVQEQEERYLVLEALPGEEMLQDFQEMVWALERLKDRTAQSSHTKCANSWTQPGLDGFDSGFIYVHITSRTQLTTHACERGEPWIVEPPFTPVDPLAVGAAVYCVAYLLQIDNMVHDEPLISSKQWIVKCRFLSRLHLPSAGARAQNPAMLVFLSRGGVPGRPLAASQALPARDETDDAEE
ncbi:hypothetical protein C8F01DRAFT_1250444 [Mycena amicta]|nr:hypothetical protein C8F01DRAFT_1250444 [Mycena amicta]